MLGFGPGTHGRKDCHFKARLSHLVLEMSQGTISHVVQAGIWNCRISSVRRGLVQTRPGEACAECKEARTPGNTVGSCSPASLPAALLVAVPQGYRVRLQQPICLFCLAFRKIPKISLECICRVAACTLMQGPRKQNNPSKLSKPAHWVPLI